MCHPIGGYMYSDHYPIQNYTMKETWDIYLTTPTKCVTTIAHKVIKCVPVITALITVGVIFSLFNQIEARYIPYQQIQTTTFIPDDVKIVPIAKAVWIYKEKIMRFCSLSNPWCMKESSLSMKKILLNSRDKW